MGIFDPSQNTSDSQEQGVVSMHRELREPLEMNEQMEPLPVPPSQCGRTVYRYAKIFDVIFIS